MGAIREPSTYAMRQAEVFDAIVKALRMIEVDPDGFVAWHRNRLKKK
ncbi:hypothetical protein M2319_004057 [Rhodobium gokarnense]|uniref:Uncharacterized protein n=1 Tax=Rhodobium gokarnense TaxID=364296 RepID=A0ABT3HH32_9HYPH|nr:hypothetical protein [Rhodobium gokarnense]